MPKLSLLDPEAIFAFIQQGGDWQDLPPAPSEQSK